MHSTFSPPFPPLGKVEPKNLGEPMLTQSFLKVDNLGIFERQLCLAPPFLKVDEMRSKSDFTPIFEKN